MFRNGEVTKRSINATKVTYFQKNFKFANASMLIYVHLFKYYIAPTLIYLLHCNAYLVSKHTANIMKCLDWEIETYAIALILRRVECPGAAPVLTILIMLWQWVSDKFNQDIERSLRHLSRLIIMFWVELIVTKMGGAHCGKNGWNWCYRHLDKNGWSSLW